VVEVVVVVVVGVEVEVGEQCKMNTSLGICRDNTETAQETQSLLQDSITVTPTTREGAE